MDVDIYHRDDLLAVQEKIRDVKGTSVIVYEQTCAAEKRRRRKRGNFPNPAKRMFINSDVCENCGDCSVQSTCVSIQPVETELGTKRKIDQSSCNNGFCPSFVTVLGAEPRKPKGAKFDDSFFAELPEPIARSKEFGATSVMVTGIGGTGVITVGAVIGMAAHLQGKTCSIYDMTGVAQKNGAVYSHLKIGNSPEDITTQRIGSGEADLILGFDVIAALSGDSDITFGPETQVIGNSEVVPTLQFQVNRDYKVGADGLQRQIIERVGDEKAHFVNASNLALKLMGDTIGANMFVVGYASQLGLLPVNMPALRKAIELNGIAISFNMTAFDLGRLYAHDPAKVLAMIEAPKAVQAQSLDELIAARAAHLTDYQNKAYADKYLGFVNTVRQAEQAVDSKSTALTEAVARNLSKLMAYKVEYEVARMYSNPEFIARLQNEFEDGYKLKFNLAPPLLSKRDERTGNLKKREFGGRMLPAFKMLAKFKGLRGTALDLPGKTAERKMERALIGEYRTAIESALGKLNANTLTGAVTLAEVPDQIRGFGHVKEAAVEKARAIMAKDISELAAS